MNFYEADIFWLIAVVPVTAIIFIFSIIFKKYKLLALTLLFAVFFTSGLINSYFRLENYRVCGISANLVYDVEGIVEEKGQTDYGEYIIVSSAKVNGNEVQEKPLSGKIRVYLAEVYDDFVDVGYKVKFKGKLKFNDIYPYGELNYYAEDNIKYTCSPYGEISATYRFSLFGSIRSSIRKTLYDNLDYDTASVCYGMLLGDTQGIDDEALASFRYGGIAHIFAVSGLHIGIIYGIFSFICKKLRLNKYFSAFLRVFAIVFYSGVCGFTLSSIRAVIMCTILILTGLLHVKADGLNNLSFAVILILLATPLSLFSIGFQLSVCAVGGILILSNGIKRTLSKIKTPKSISKTVGTTFGAQAGTLPVMMANFGYVSGVGLILNLVLIPLISVLFMAIFAGTVISLIIPQIAGTVVQLTALPLEAVLSFLIVADFEKSIITGFGAGLFVPLYFIAILAFSDKVNLQAVSRGVIASCGLAVLTVCVLLYTYTPVNAYKISIGASNYGGSVLIKSSRGNVLIMTEEASITQIVNSLSDDYASNLDGVIILGGNECLQAYNSRLKCDGIYVCELNTPVQPYQNATVHYEKVFLLCGIEFNYESGYCVTAEMDGIKMCVCASENIPVENCDLLVSYYENYDEETKSVQCLAKNTVYFNLRNCGYNVYDCGKITFFTDSGELKMKQTPLRYRTF
ncbi:MAG: ComEC/Rec2 family competence protein [Clostridia bacterium]|nr:ComEC/Rec2 family competence protein [Clostridia bacterium]